MNLDLSTAIGSFATEAVGIVGPNDSEAVRLLTAKTIAGYVFSTLMSLKIADVPLREFSVEQRLNNAGFKIFFSVSREGNLSARIGGDQCENHQEAYLVLTMLLKKYCLMAEERLNGQFEPFYQPWIDQHWESFAPWAWEWVRDHPELLPTVLKQM
jgi:hypothetical protein